MPEIERRYIVSTDNGDVVVRLRDGALGLDADLLDLSMADPAATAEIGMTTPLRAFAAKMVDLIEIQGVGEFAGGPRMREMLVREKATADLRRIERFAKEHAAPEGD